MKDGVWMDRMEVITFRGLAGDHGGKNIGCFIVGLLDHVGIMAKKVSKVCPDPLSE